MFSFKQISNYSNRCYFCLHKKITCNQRNLCLKPGYPKKESNTKCLDKILEEYKDRLLFNSVVESKRMNYGYKENMKKIKNTLRYEERISTVLKTVRPLPLCFKYLKESETQESPKEVNDKEKLAGSEVIHNNETYEFSAKFPYHANTQISESNYPVDTYISVESKILTQKEQLDKNMEHWMTSYDNYEYDLVQNENKTVVKNKDNWKINYGTPNPYSSKSNYPCGGCGAHLHCMDTAIPGYIPSEIFENCFKPGGTNLGSILCQRCHFLKEYDIALQVRVSSDDYPNVLKTIPFNSALVVLMVDLTDFPCSIWPGIADILGPKTPIVVVGNKLDLLPKDSDKFLNRIKKVLYDNVKLCGFANANIKHVELISAKTGFGVENLITSMQSVWRRKGDVYLIGCVNVGKSSLFNALLQSDFCKIQAADLIQRATTSPWPGTTLNLLKFPMTNLLGYRSFLRHQRLRKLETVEAQERDVQKKSLKEHNSINNATLIGRIERSFDKPIYEDEPEDSFSLQGNANLSGKSRMGLNTRDPQYALGKWCFDTPGVVHPGAILHLLTTEELVKTLPKQLIRPETFCVKPGTSLFIAGIARFDYVNGPNSIRLTVFRAKDLPITLCKTNEADSYYKELVGTELFVIPIDKGDRMAKWPGLQLAKTFKLIGRSWDESSYDVVLSNAGWISINCGIHEYEFQAWTPEKRGVNLRDSVLPKAVKLRGARIRYSVAYRRNKFV